MKKTPDFLAIGVILVPLVLAGCSSCHHHVNAMDAGPDSGSDGGLDAGPDAGLDAGIIPDPVTSLTVAPANQQLDTDASSSTPASLTFTVIAQTLSGKTLTPTGVWSFDASNIAHIDQAGVLQTTNSAGGTSAVHFRSGTLSGSTALTVTLHTKDNSGQSLNPGDSVKSAFKNPTGGADPLLNLLYPYDKTVFPKGLPSPLVQWNGGASGDIFWIRAFNNTFTFDVYLNYASVAAPSPAYTFPSDVWQKLNDSVSGPITFSLQRYSGGAAYQPLTESWTIASASIKGTIYYTQLLTGQTNVMRIKPGGTAETFLSNTETCTACHSVSANGQRIVAGLNGGDSQWAVWDTSTGNRLYRSSEPSGFQVISPDGNYVLYGHWRTGDFKSSGALTLSSATDSRPLAQLSLPNPQQGYPGHPVWSNDNQKIAFSVRSEDDGLLFFHSSLWLTNVTLPPAAPGFADVRKIVDFSNSSLPVATYPSFSPDSSWIAYMRSNSSRTGVGANGLFNGQPTSGELWLTSLDGANQVRLDAANGNGNQSFGPTFHPKQIGDYYWLAFFSQRPYGHQAFSGNRQIWLAAVDAKPLSASTHLDPSHPAIYLTGQNQTSTNERPQFTLNACGLSGQSCEISSDCCGALFCGSADGGQSCQSNSVSCSPLGNSCNSDQDCCSGLPCAFGTCGSSPIN